jgi:hypothetical protein
VTRNRRARGGGVRQVFSSQLEWVPIGNQAVRGLLSLSLPLALSLFIHRTISLSLSLSR